MDKVRVFEVDQPDTVSVKEEKIREIFGSVPANVTYVPADLGAVKLGQRLAEEGYDRSQKTLFTMEGLIYYLPPGAVDGLFDFIARNVGKGSAVVFDYGQKEVQGSAGGDFAKQQGEPVKSFIDGPIETFLSDRGFRLIRQMDSSDYKKAYFHGKNAGREVSNRAHFAYAEIE
jgi:methyltransferase (TIGR00027 family)